MPATEVIIDIQGLQQTLLKLGVIREIITDMTPINQEIGEYLVNFYKNDVYDSQGEVYGTPWKSLTEKYAKQKEKNYPGRPILVRTGAMRGAYVLTVSNNSVLIQNTATSKNGAFYGYFHQWGTRKMAQRILIDVDTERMNTISDIIVNGLMVEANL